MYFSSMPANFKFYAICLIKESYNFLYFFAGQHFYLAKIKITKRADTS